MLRYLAERSNVYLASLTDEPLSKETEKALDQLCERHVRAPIHRYRKWVNGAASLAKGRTATEGLFHCKALHQTVSRWARETRFDAAIAFCSSMAQYLPPELAGAPTIVDLVDVDSEKWRQYANKSRGPKRWLYGWEARRVRRLECRLAEQVTAMTVVSEAEAELFRSFCPSDRIQAVGNGVDTDYFRPPAERADGESLNCVFIGVLDYYPNEEGICWFCEQVWPQVRQKLPAATLSIVGRHATARVKELSSVAGVEVIGEVPDVRPHLAKAAVSIAPLQIARGVQNKVLEAMSAGTPVLATQEALTGLQAVAGEDAVVAAGAPQWQEELVRLLSDRDLQKKLAINGRNYVERHHSWRRCLAPLAQLAGLARESQEQGVGGEGLAVAARSASI